MRATKCSARELVQGSKITNDHKLSSYTFTNRSNIHFDDFDDHFAIHFSSGQRWGFGRHLAAAVCAMVLAEDLDQVADLAPCCWSKMAPEESRRRARMDFYLDLDDLVISKCEFNLIQF